MISDTTYRRRTPGVRDEGQVPHELPHRAARRGDHPSDFVALTLGGSGQVEVEAYSVWKVLPYLVVLVGRWRGECVRHPSSAPFSSLIVGVASGAFAWTQIFAVMGTGCHLHV